MTYKDILEILLTATPEELSQTVTVYSRGDDEYMPSLSLETSNEETCDVLDPGHLYLTVE